MLKIRLWLLCWMSVSPLFAQDVKPWKIVQREDVAKVWSGNPVGFAFLEKNGQLFAAFYSGEDKSLVVAQKKSPAAAWIFKTLPTKIGWDSHNYVAMAFDADNILHVSGNMHGVPMVYFRAEKPMDVESLQTLNRMLAADTSRESLQAASENQVTYPQFFKTPTGEMIFTYRDGSSGNGSQIWNRYDVKTRTWCRFLDQPMFDGEGDCNAYFQGPIRDTNGVYHVAWVWRDTPDAATNHDLSYMKSRDLVHWEKSDGTPLSLPVTRKTGEIVAPLQNGQGLLNSHIRVGFDAENRVILTYTRYDENQNNQLMQARLENGVWKTYQTTDWTHRWVFSGGGCLPGELRFSPVSVRDGKLIQYWNRKNEKSGEFELDSATLKPVGPAPKLPATPGICTKCENPQENQCVKTGGMTDSRNSHRRYLFVWETLPVNRDRPWPVVPEPSTLRMFVLERE